MIDEYIEPNNAPILVGRYYCFKDSFVGKVNLKLIDRIKPSNSCSEFTHVWYHEILGYSYSIGNYCNDTSDLNKITKEKLLSLLQIIEENEIN